MPQILVQCKKCQRIFSSGIELGVGASATLIDNISHCPFCGSIENIPDGTFRGTVEGVIKILENSSNKLQAAKELLESLEKNSNITDLSKVKKSSKPSQFKKWLPDSPQKIAIYIAILQTIIQLLTKNPTIQIEYNNFINIYNHVIVNQTK